MVKAIVGANWGDEGKGKITDMLAQDADVVVRFQGGSNAGHTIVNQYGKFALHQLPSGVFNSRITNIIGNGVALSVENFTKELASLKDRGVPAPRILVSDRAQLVMPYHLLLDTCEEERLAGRSFGSTRSGIAPFYSDKAAKTGFQVCQLWDPEDELKARIRQVIEIKNTLLVHLYHREPLTVEEVYTTLMAYREQLAPYAADTFHFLRDAVGRGDRILLEGQLGALKDPDFGIYPMVTSSNTIAGYGAVGAGLPAREIGEVICVVKAYSSAVGAGEFVSEIFGDEAEELRRRGGDGGEYGATTGRPRRMGWLDLVASRYGCQVQGATQAAFTVLDALGYLERIPVCVGYEIDGRRVDHFPNTSLLHRARPILETLPGWQCDIRGIRRYQDLPKACRDYVEFAEKGLGVPITMVSNGPAREDIIYR